MDDRLLDLLASPPSPPMEVDEAAVYAGGRARVRRRGWVRGGLAATTAVALGGLAWTALPIGGAHRDVRPGGTATSRVVSTNCSDLGTSLGESGPLKVGAATVSLRARVGTCDGIRVETSYTIPGYSETGVTGSGRDSALSAVFTIVGMNDQGWGPARTTAAMIVLPPGQRICSLTHAGRPDDDLRPSMPAARTESWANGWSFVAQPLPADAAQWEWRLLTCGAGRTLVPINVPAYVDSSGPAYVSSRPVPAVLPLGNGDRLVVGRVDPGSGAIPLTLTSTDGTVLALDSLRALGTPGQPATRVWADSSSATFVPRLGGHSLVIAVSGPDIPTNALATTCGPAVKVTMARSVVVPGSRLRLNLFEVHALDGGPAPAASLTGASCPLAGPP